VLRSTIVDQVLGIADPEERVQTLLAMIDIQPESASRGHLFAVVLMNLNPTTGRFTRYTTPPPRFLQ